MRSEVVCGRGSSVAAGRLWPRVVCGVVSGPDCGRSWSYVFGLLIARRHGSRVIPMLPSKPAESAKAMVLNHLASVFRKALTWDVNL